MEFVPWRNAQNGFGDDVHHWIRWTLNVDDNSLGNNHDSSLHSTSEGHRFSERVVGRSRDVSGYDVARCSPDLPSRGNDLGPTLIAGGPTLIDGSPSARR